MLKEGDGNMIKYAILDIETDHDDRKVYSKKKIGQCCKKCLGGLEKAASESGEQIAICPECGNQMDIHTDS